MATTRPKIVSLITRRYPFLSGVARFANSRHVRLLAGDHNETAWTRLRSGPEILVPLDDHVGRAAYYVGDLDRKITEIMRRIVRPGDTALDVGANLGVITLGLAKLVGPTGVVHSFEPNPRIREMLEKSIARNQFTNVRLHACALGEQDGGALTLSFPKHNAGQATLSPTRSQEGWDHVEVPIRSLSSLAAELNLPAPRLMKVDVEGFESQVFRGALPWLATNPPDAIIFESNEPRGGDEPDPALPLLASHDFALYSIPKALFSPRLVAYRLGVKQSVTSHDMLAARKDREREIISKFTVES